MYQVSAFRRRASCVPAHWMLARARGTPTQLLGIYIEHWAAARTAWRLGNSVRGRG